MRSEAVYVKTELGRSEIDTRAMKLSPALRSILLVVDGQRNVTQLRGLAQRLHAPDDALDQLSRIGLIGRADVDDAPAAVPLPSSEGDAAASRYRVLSGLMSEAVRAHLGLRGYFMQLKIERCASGDELAALLPELTAAIAKAKGDAHAAQWQQGVREAAAA